MDDEGTGSRDGERQSDHIGGRGKGVEERQLDLLRRSAREGEIEGRGGGED